MRVDPEATQSIIEPAAKRPAAKAAPESTSDDTQKVPPVSEENSKAWHELYRRVCQGRDDTMENAFKSARGMFPGKFVSRERVRGLAGGRTQGRKAR